MALRWPSKPAVFPLLMLLSALIALVPGPWSRPLAGVLQPLAPLQWVFSAGSHAVREAARLDRSSTEAAHQQQVEELRRQIAHQAILIDGLERQLREVSGLREQMGTTSARILVATVVARDATPSRESITISLGSERGVRVGQWVAAGLDPVDGRQNPAPLGTEPQARKPRVSGWDLLARQWLIGRVCETAPFVSRVRLSTDPLFEPVPVHVALVQPDGSWKLSEREFALRGMGRGRMEIPESTEDLVKSGYQAALAGLSATLPARLILGRLESAEPHPEAPLHFNITVRPLAPPQNLRHVYVIDVP